MTQLVNIFHIGPPKTATTWVYECLKLHPQIAASPKDSIHYFDMHYARGHEWYAQHFSAAIPGQKLFDPTPSYIWSPKAPDRIHKYNPDARIMFTLRNPIERAFSHFWHLKKQGATTLTFDKVLYGYDYFSTWLEPGLLGKAIERYLELFSKDQLHWILYEDIENNPVTVFKNVTRFCGIDDEFTPPSLYQKVNVAGSRRTLRGRIAQSLGWRLSKSANDEWVRIGEMLLESEKTPAATRPGSLAYWTSGKKEYLRGIDPELRFELQTICEPEIGRMEDLLEIDLSAWRSNG